MTAAAVPLPAPSSQLPAPSSQLPAPPGTYLGSSERVMVWMSRAHRSFVGLDASSYISRCSLCEWCTTQRHNDTTTQRHNDTTTQRHNDHSQLLQVRNSFVVLSFGPGQLAPMEPAQCHSVCVCVSACLAALRRLRATAIYLLTCLSRSRSLSVSVSVSVSVDHHRGGDCARP